MKKIRILSFILAAVIMTSLFAGCAAKKEDEKKTKKDSSETETEIVTDENGETTVIYVEKKVNTEKETEDGGESEEESEAETGKDGKPAKTDGKKPAETTGVGKEDGKTAKKDSGGKNTAETTTGKESFEPIEIPMETQAKKDPNDAKLPDGIKIESVSISRLEDMVNIDFKVSNSKDFDQIVDFSYVVMKINNTTEVLNTFNTMPIQGGKTITCSMPIEDDSADLSIGRSVSVYYGNDLIGIAVVSPF